jgi:Ca2+-binding RTX toxin-like protein
MYERNPRSNVTSTFRAASLAALFCGALLPSPAWADWNPVSVLAADGTLILAPGTAGDEIVLVSDDPHGAGPLDDTLEVTYFDENLNITEESHAVYSGGVQVIARIFWLAGGGGDLFDYDHGGGFLPVEIDGEEGDDGLCGGEADDVLLGGDGDDALLGGDGDDTLKGGIGDDHIEGHDGEDWIIGGYGADTIHGDDDDDTIDSGEIDGSVGAYFYDNDDEIHGGDGNDHIEGGVGDDQLYGGAWGDPDGDDVILGGSGGDLLCGDDGDDQLAGGPDLDFIVGGAGEDELNGGRDGEHDFLVGDEFSSFAPKAADTFHQHVNYVLVSGSYVAYDEDTIADYNPRYGDVIVYSHRRAMRGATATKASVWDTFGPISD